MLFVSQAELEKAGVETSEIDGVMLALQLQSLRAWKNEGPSVGEPF